MLEDDPTSDYSTSLEANLLSAMDPQVGEDELGDNQSIGIELSNISIVCVTMLYLYTLQAFQKFSCHKRLGEEEDPKVQKTHNWTSSKKALSRKKNISLP